MVKAKVIILKKYFERLPKISDFGVAEEELPPIKNGEFLAEAKFISVDPYMRGHALRNFKIGDNFEVGDQIAQIVESKNPIYPVGKYIQAPFGWRSHTVSDGKAPDGNKFFVLPNLGKIPLSLGVGILGMPGRTAYFGLLEICKPKAGETVVVSGAAGCVGSTVGQIAKIIGCKVIGIAGSQEKGQWLVKELGFDNFIDYKTTPDLDAALTKLIPEGADCYFDNVGGDTSTAVLKHMKTYGRIAVCGAISTYSSEQDKKAVQLPFSIVGQELKIEGFLVRRWNHRISESFETLSKWLQEGKIKYAETITEGFENTPKAFIDMFNGVNTGKAVVKV